MINMESHDHDRPEEHVGAVPSYAKYHHQKKKSQVIENPPFKKVTKLYSNFVAKTILPKLIRQLKSNDLKTQTFSIMKLRTLLSQDCVPIKLLKELDGIPVILSYLKMHKYPELQAEAAWACSAIAAGSSDDTKIIVDEGVIDILSFLLTKNNVEVKLNSLDALSNIACDCTEYRDLALYKDVLSKLIDIIRHEPDKPLPLIRSAASCLSSLCGGTPQPEESINQKALPIILSLLQSEDDEVVASACWAISYLSQGSDTKIQSIIDSGIVPYLVRLLDSKNPSILSPALKSVGNIVTGTDGQTQRVIDSNALPLLRTLLDNKAFRQEAAWTISNITAGNSKQVQLVIQAKLIPPLVHLFTSEDCEWDVKKEAGWAIANATENASNNNIQYFVNHKCIGPLCLIIASARSDDQLLSAGLGGIKNILNSGEKMGNLPKYCQLIAETGLIHYIDRYRRTAQHVRTYKDHHSPTNVSELIAATTKDDYVKDPNSLIEQIGRPFVKSESGKIEVDMDMLMAMMSMDVQIIENHLINIEQIMSYFEHSPFVKAHFDKVYGVHIQTYHDHEKHFRFLIDTIEPVQSTYVVDDDDNLSTTSATSSHAHSTHSKKQKKKKKNKKNKKKKKKKSVPKSTQHKQHQPNQNQQQAQQKEKEKKAVPLPTSGAIIGECCLPDCKTNDTDIMDSDDYIIFTCKDHHKLSMHFTCWEKHFGIEKKELKCDAARCVRCQTYVVKTETFKAGSKKKEVNTKFEVPSTRIFSSTSSKPNPKKKKEEKNEPKNKKGTTNPKTKEVPKKKEEKQKVQLPTPKKEEDSKDEQPDDSAIEIPAKVTITRFAVSPKKQSKKKQGAPKTKDAKIKKVKQQKPSSQQPVQNAWKVNFVEKIKDTETETKPPITTPVTTDPKPTLTNEPKQTDDTLIQQTTKPSPEPFVPPLIQDEDTVEKIVLFNHPPIVEAAPVKTTPPTTTTTTTTTTEEKQQVANPWFNSTTTQPNPPFTTTTENKDIINPPSLQPLLPPGPTIDQPSVPSTTHPISWDSKLQGSSQTPPSTTPQTMITTSTGSPTPFQQQRRSTSSMTFMNQNSLLYSGGIMPPQGWNYYQNSMGSFNSFIESPIKEHNNYVPENIPNQQTIPHTSQNLNISSQGGFNFMPNFNQDMPAQAEGHSIWSNFWDGPNTNRDFAQDDTNLSASPSSTNSNPSQLLPADLRGNNHENQP